MWPFKAKTEVRAAPSGYTDMLVAALQAQAAGGDSSPAATGAVEAACAVISRALSAASVENAGPFANALTPAMLGMAGRALVVRGECAFLIETGGGMPELLPCASWDVTGGDPRPAAWTYRVDLAGPSGTSTRQASGADVVHFRWSCDPAQPWRGVSPIARAGLTGRALAAAETAIGNEAKGPHGHLMAVGDQLPPEAATALHGKITGLKGGLALLETQASWSAMGPQSAPKRDWAAERIGFNAPESLNAAAAMAARGILGAVGIPPALFEAKGDGSGQREAWRRTLHGTLAPLAKILETELRAKLEQPRLAINMDPLHASDISGRARAFGSLVKGGMDVTEAARLSGLLSED